VDIGRKGQNEQGCERDRNTNDPIHKQCLLFYVLPYGEISMIIVKKDLPAQLL
jgi:hypothetical protein|tara:strand:+ start:1132 stop:1290 length:159 start_codon:yes stop_codon:yes gene_type:complete